MGERKNKKTGMVHVARTVELRQDVNDRVVEICQQRNISISSYLIAAVNASLAGELDVRDPRDIEIERLRERLRVIEADQAYQGWMQC